jgi:LemA protein
MSIGLIVLVVIIVLVAWVVSAYNNFISLKVKVNNAWSDIDVYLKKRFDLIPNLVETVKGYASHEQETLEKVIAARSAYVSAGSAEDKIAAEAGMSGMLRQLFALSESYPDLKATTGFVQLQEQLEEIEDHIAQARRYYNAIVRDFNTAIQMFPGNIVAGMMKLVERSMFEANEEEKETVKVDFGTKPQ